MENEKDELVDEYTVVVNDEEQYSIWRSTHILPAGWRNIGVSGSKQMCLEHINSVWKDMRPASLRRAMLKSSNSDG
jgi:MbtH protein